MRLPSPEKSESKSLNLDKYENAIEPNLVEKVDSGAQTSYGLALTSSNQIMINGLAA